MSKCPNCGNSLNPQIDIECPKCKEIKDIINWLQLLIAGHRMGNIYTEKEIKEFHKQVLEVLARLNKEIDENDDLFKANALEQELQRGLYPIELGDTLADATARSEETRNPSHDFTKGHEDPGRT